MRNELRAEKRQQKFAYCFFVQYKPHLAITMDRVIANGEEYLAVPERGMAAYRAPSMTQPHKARQALRDAYEGKIDPLICYYCGVGSVPTARVMAQFGADMIWIDWEHASMGVETMTSVSRACSFELAAI